MAGQVVRILDGNTFVVCDERGDVEASPSEPTGLFSFDTRFLSTWVLTVNGQRLNSLSVDDLQYFQSRFFLVPGTGTVYIDAKLSVIRERSVGNGFHEELTILNHENEPVDLEVRVEAASDFADLFEVKDALKKLGTYASSVEDGKLVLGYVRKTFKRETVISASATASVDERGLTFRIRIEPHAAWTTDLDVVTSMAGPAGSYARPKYGRGRKQARPNMETSLEKWIEDAPRLECDLGSLKSTYRRSLIDLAALRFSPPIAGRQEPARRGPPVVHDDVRARQHLHQPADVAVHARAGRDDPARPRHLAGQPPGRLPRRGPGPDPPRDALRRDGGLRGTAPLAVLRRRGLDPAVRRAARRVRALDRRPEARARPGVRGARRAELDRRVRRPHGQRLHLVQAPQRADGAREPVLEGSVELDRLQRRALARLPAGDLRAAGLRL